MCGPVPVSVLEVVAQLRIRDRKLKNFNVRVRISAVRMPIMTSDGDCDCDWTVKDSPSLNYSESSLVVIITTVIRVKADSIQPPRIETNLFIILMLLVYLLLTVVLGDIK